MYRFPRPCWGRDLAALALALGALTVQAATVIALSEADLIDRADLVVHGIVLSSQSSYRGGRGVRVVTEVALEVHEVLKGSYPEAVLTVVLPGGQRGSQVTHVPGTPRFFPGEQVCLFLARLPGGAWTPLGISQGKYQLSPDPGTGLLVARQAHGVRAVPGGSSGSASHALRAGAPPVSAWGSLRQRILARGGGAR